MAEEGVIKCRRPKEEVKGPSELLPPKHTHQVLGTWNFSQGGSAFRTGLDVSVPRVDFITSSQTDAEPSHCAIVIQHECI